MSPLVRLSALVAVLVLSSGTTALGQSSRQKEAEKRIEKDFERRFERLGKTIEATVDQVVRANIGRADIEGIVATSVDGAMRALESSLIGLEAYQDYDRRRGRDQDRDRDQAASRIDTTFAFSRDGTVDLTTFHGDITVRGWNRQQAQVKASTERGLLRRRFSSGRISLEADLSRGRGETTYEVTVPQGVRVVLRSMSGDISVQGTRGPVDAHTNNGDVTVIDAAERVDMGSLSGDVIGRDLRGSVEASSLNGEVHLSNVEGRSVQAESTSGDIVLDGVTSPDIDVSTVSGEVNFTGQFARGGTYNFQSHAGEVNLRVPGDVSARFGIETFSGSLDSDFPVTLQPNRERRSGRRLEFTVGSGDARVVAESFSGTITIRRINRR